MKRLLITDIDTPLGFELLSRFLHQGNKVIAVQSGKELGFKLPKTAAKPLEIIYWKKTSSLSTRNLIIKCKSICNSLDGALLLNLLPETDDSMEKLSISAIEQIVDRWIKGSLFFIKDFIDYFKKLNRGMLSVITCYTEKNKNKAELVSSLYVYFESLLETLIKEYKQQEINIHGFFTKQLKIETCSEYLVKNITEKCYKSGGRLFHF
ncbi:MAG: hypothetical protein JW822_00455 [Spirochaetales bacterium]|nr:hypothetical protein [Spirochaetales bacterium]